MLRRISLRLVCVLALALGVAPLAAFASEQAPDISPTALHERLEGADPPLVLDVRTPAEFASGHIPGAVNIPHTELTARIGEVEGKAPHGVVVHCARGPRARIAEGILIDAGVPDVEHLDGGLIAWTDAGLPVAK